MKDLYIILLAAGSSSRFNNSVPKQIYHWQGYPLVQYSIKTIQTLKPTQIIIISNSKAFETIENLNKELIESSKIQLILNNDLKSDRLDSIELGLKYLESINCSPESQIIIHDVARPFVQTENYQALIKSEKVYAQYYLPIRGGLLNQKTFEFLNRDDYIEMVTPLIIKYSILKEIYFQFLAKDQNGHRNHFEFIPILKEKGLDFELLEGHFNQFRKITVLEDLD